jgi:hypothetical protein
MGGIFEFLKLTAMNMLRAEVKAEEMCNTQHSLCLCMHSCIMLALNWYVLDIPYAVHQIMNTL